MQPVNRSIALAVLAIIIALQTPWLDPYRLTANNQFHRVADGRVPVAEFDFGYLKFDLGPAGADALERLRRITSHPELDALKSALTDLDRYSSAYAWNQRNRESQLSLTSAQPLPAALTESVRRDAFAINCIDSPCLAFPITIVADQPPSYGVLTARVWDPIFVYAQQPDGAWQRTGQFAARQFNSESVRPSIEAGDYAAVPTVMPDLRIGSRRFRFEENTAAPVAASQ